MVDLSIVRLNYQRVANFQTIPTWKSGVVVLSSKLFGCRTPSTALTSATNRFVPLAISGRTSWEKQHNCRALGNQARIPLHWPTSTCKLWYLLWSGLVKGAVQLATKLPVMVWRRISRLECSRFFLHIKGWSTRLPFVTFHPAFAQLSWRGIYECILCEPGDFCNGCDTFTRPNGKNFLSISVSGCRCASSPSIGKGVLTTRNRLGKGPGPLSQSVFEVSLVPKSLHGLHSHAGIFMYFHIFHSGFTHLPLCLSIGLCDTSQICHKSWSFHPPFWPFCFHSYGRRCLFPSLGLPPNHCFPHKHHKRSILDDFGEHHQKEPPSSCVLKSSINSVKPRFRMRVPLVLLTVRAVQPEWRPLAQIGNWNSLKHIETSASWQLEGCDDG